MITTLIKAMDTNEFLHVAVPLFFQMEKNAFLQKGSLNPNKLTGQNVTPLRVAPPEMEKLPK